MGEEEGYEGDGPVDQGLEGKKGRLVYLLHRASARRWRMYTRALAQVVCAVALIPSGRKSIGKTEREYRSGKSRGYTAHFLHCSHAQV